MKATLILVSVLTTCISGGLAAVIPAAVNARDVVVGPAVQVINDQPVWFDDDELVFGNETDPTPVLQARQRPAPTAYTSAQGKFSRDMLKVHNDLRAIHDAPPLVWNKVLATFASRQARRCDFKHSGGPYGENLAGGGPMNNPVWYQWHLYTERNNYDWSKPGFSKATGHFTQLVWKASREVGCAWVAGCSNLSYQVWCEYYPAGNVAPQINYINNVGRSKRGIPAAPPTHDSYYS